VLSDRFELGDVVGSGASSVVVRGLDRATGAPVAIKRVRITSSLDRERFAREVAALRRLVHPGIARWIADGELGTDLALVTEWVEGETLARRLARAPLGEAEAGALVTQLSEALEHAHAAGIVHRDVKPSNVVLGPSGPVVVDFGIALVADDPRLTVTGAVVGTPAFMAPEQIRGASTVDPRADVYALGALWFTALTGRAPFVADTNLALLAMVLLDDPPAVRTFAPATSEHTEHAIARMLAKERERRPPSMRAVRALLAPDAGEAVTARERRWTTLLLASISDDEDAARARAHGATTVARFGDALVAAFAEAPAESALGACACALALGQRRPDASIAIATERAEAGAALRPAAIAARILGPAGVFVDAATAALVASTYDAPEREGTRRLAPKARAVESPCVGRDRERRTLAMLFDECVEERVVRVAIVSGAPGVGKSHLLRAVADELRAHTLRAVAAPSTRSVGFALAAQLVALQLDAVVAEPRARADAVRARVAEELVALAPVIVVLDDLQWADPPSAAAIEAVLTELEHAAVLVLVATRDESDHALAGFRKRGALDLRLGPLPAGASLALSTALVGDVEAAAAIAARAAGHPLSIAELARAHRAGARELPVTVTGALEARIARAPPSARQVLRAAAIVGTAFDPRALAPLVPTLDVAAELAALARLDFIHSRRNLMEFDHDLLREAAYEMLDLEDRARGHRVHAEWLAREGAPPATIAAHFALGGERAHAARAWVAALRAANASGDHAGALHSYQEGMSCADDREVQGELEAARAETHRWAGEQDAVKLHAERALTLLSPHAAARFAALAEASSAASATADRERVAEVALALANIRPAALEPSALDAWVDSSLRILTHLVVVDRKAEFDALFAVVAPHAERDPRPVIAARLDRVRSQLAHRNGDLAGFARHLQAALAGLERAGDRRNAVILRLSAGHAAMQLGAWERARKLLEDARTEASRLRLGDVQWVIRLNLALVAHRLGATDAPTTARAVAEHFAAHGNKRLEGSARAYLSGMLVDRAELADARREAESALELGAAHPQVVVLAATALAREALAVGDVARALASTTRGMALLDAIVDEGEAELRLVHGEALRAAGRRDEARACIAELRARLETTAASLGEDAAGFLRIPAHMRTLVLAKELS
jgi:hypothetical protein